ncbi:hypothetical protein BD769DRAFT_1393419 [Suillus cothurnatus]|nr:hypothetical protein BD769DRAFT_1393419 [Suillus cothurnatus]
MDDDERSASRAHSSKGDQTDWTEDSDDDLYQSIISDNGEDYMDMEDSVPHNDVHDLVQSIKGMYRVLDLISEQGSGSYVSMTKVKFSVLDSLIVKPVGIYGNSTTLIVSQHHQ